MKKLLISFIASMMAIMSFAQSTLVATLTHGSTIKMFYGVYALQQAHNAAANGDVINLSGGTFQSVDNITKGVTIRGTGTLEAFPTIISGWVTINVPSNISNKLSFEGCCFNSPVTLKGTTNDVLFLKNSFNYDVGVIENAKHIIFVNCNINYSLYYGDESSCTLYNSYIRDPKSGYGNNSTVNFINCAINHSTIDGSGLNLNLIHNAIFVNCFLFLENGWSYSYYNKGIPVSSSAYYCVAVGTNAIEIFNDMIIKENCTSATKTIFTDGNPWNDLTDEAKTKYLGNDGTPVGMYGGVYPFSLVPSYPTITKMNVANKTTADGKLSVEIEVSAAE